MAHIPKPGPAVMVYETYQCSMANGLIEYGYTFKRPGADYTVGDDTDTEFDLVLGAVKDGEPKAVEQMREDWAKHEWAALAVCNAAVKE